MAFLEQFSDQEQNLIVSLPYRAGLWLSRSDVDGGAAADYEELHALEDIIEKKAAGATHSAFVKEVMQKAMDWQSRWKDWAQQLDTLEQDCGKVVALLSQKLSDQDIGHYRQSVLTVTREVAEAFREVDVDATFMVRMMIKAQISFDRFKALFG